MNNNSKPKTAAKVAQVDEAKIEDRSNGNEKTNMKTLPAGLREYKRTPDFNADTLPKGFLHRHSTKEGTWGLLEVEAGSVVYVIDDEADRGRYTLRQGDRAVITPCQLHHLESASPDLVFHVKFLK